MKLCLEASTVELSRLFQALQAQARQDGLSSRVTMRVMLAAEELFMNLVQHGRPLEIVVELQGTHLTVQDRGEPFNPLEVPAPDLDRLLRERIEGGLGLHFVRSVAERAQYRREGEWNRVDLWIETGPLPSDR